MALSYREVREAMAGIPYITAARVSGARAEGFIFVTRDGQKRVLTDGDKQRAVRHFDEAAKRWLPDAQAFKRVSTASAGFWVDAEQELPSGVKAQEGWPCEETVWSEATYHSTLCNRLAPELGGKCGVHAAADRRVRENAEKRARAYEARKQEAQRRAGNRRRAEEVIEPFNRAVADVLGIMAPGAQATADGVSVPAEVIERVTVALRVIEDHAEMIREEKRLGR